MMTSPDTNKVLLITGSTGGIGRATAVLFAKEGCYDLALHFNAASRETQQELSKAITAAVPEGCKIRHAFFQADLASTSEVRNLHRAVVDLLGPPNLLFNNAGSACGVSGPQSLQDVPYEIFERSWRVNTGSAILLTQLCLPVMEERAWGRVVFCSSLAAFTGGSVGPHHAGAKSALHGVVHWVAGNVARNVGLLLTI